jgi:hypothetical protein
MTNSVNYNYVPNQSVYVINTLGPNGQYPYWGYPYPNTYGYCYPVGGPVGYPTNYPNGFTSTTPAIQHGVVLQTRIMFTTTNPPVPTIMYDIRIDGEMGTTVFPEAMVYPATPGTAGSQDVSYGGTLTQSTAIVKPSATYTNTIFVNGQPNIISVDLSTTPTLANALIAINSQLTGAMVTLVGGNLSIVSALLGTTSSIYVTTDILNPDIFGNLPGYVGFLPPVTGTASGLDQATAAYEAMVK